jgi:hypothetical protein
MPKTTTVNVTTQRATFAALLAALVTGINTELTGVDPFVVDGQTIARADLLGRIQAALDAIGAVKAARTQLQSTVAKQKVAIADARTLRAGVKRLAQSKFGPSSPTLQKLGFTPTRQGRATVRTKAKAQVQAEATRTARGTKGKKARLAITATAPAAPATTTPAPTTPAAPATPKS